MILLRMLLVIVSLVYCCVATLIVRINCPGMSGVPSNKVGYGITSSVLCCNFECKGFVLGPVRYFPSNVGGYSITSSL